MNSEENCSIQLSADREPTILAYACFCLIILAVVSFIALNVNCVTVERGETKVIYRTFAPTIASLLRERGITIIAGSDNSAAKLKEGGTITFDSLSCDLNDKVKDGMKIKITHNRIEKVTEEREIPPPVRREWDVFLDSGKQKIKEAGHNGLIQDTLLVYYRDGKMISRKKVDSQVVVNPKPTVIAMGSYEAVSRDVDPRHVTSRGGGTGTEKRQSWIRAGQPVKFEATAYTHTGYRTATGAKTRRGIVAVDPRVIPLGTKMFIEGYGYGIAADTGGAIKGRKIDVFIETESGALKWGRRKVDVYILPK